jgi:dTDP-4-dehydrorhamnose 3,5-epimerase
MRFTETAVTGVVVIEVERLADERGFFGRTWCDREAAAAGLELRTVQCNISYNYRKGTLRGMHYQLPPFEEIKLVRCTSGAIYDVAVDIRRDSPTAGRHVAVELSAENRRMLYIPAGCAHGFLTLSDDTEVFYQMSAFYSAQHARGFRWNDARFGIHWPAPIEVISDRDRTYPDFTPAPAGAGKGVRQ